ncbi:MAG: thioredoxin domain-containing protein [Halanaeroarchaeum sp.]
MTEPTDRNRLGDEQSPYLQAHADNPVNWQPWDDDALAAARERDVPIFLSIGYSSCHWCHVMAEESFEDPDIARRLNEDFVPIKVDREERPDLDSIYMTVCRQVSRGGCGWPLSVFLTPDARPFFVGTYFPPEESRGRPGFGDLLRDVATSWETEREDLRERAEQWMAAARGELEDVPQPSASTPGADVLAEAARDLRRTADRSYGGFGRGQKFPQVGRLRVVARAADRSSDEEYLDVLTESLDAMAEGGLRDHLGGGFHRYCTDRDWTVPHFEKMLYDNAEIPQAFLVGYQLTGDARYAAIAAESFAFLDRELRHPGGGFYSTLDARSAPADGDGRDTAGRGQEGVFYTWTPSEVRIAMTEATAADDYDGDAGVLATLFTERFGVTDAGDVEGRSVLNRETSIAELTSEFDRPEDEIESLLDVARGRALAARSDRPRPPRDEKVLAGWNGLAIASLAEGALVLGEDEYAEMAREALTFVRERLWNGSRLARRYKDGDASEEGYLEDYAFLARGALALHESTGDFWPLSFALDLGRAIEERFWDLHSGTLYFTAHGEDELPVRPQDVSDQSTPSSTGVAVDVLGRLAALDPGAEFETIAERVLRTHADAIRDSPGRHPTLVRAADDFAHGHLELTLSAESTPGSWLDAIGERFVPGRLITHRPPREAGIERWLDRLGIEGTPPLWAGREAQDGPTAYVCRGACSPPVRDVAAIEEWIEEFARPT